MSNSSTELPKVVHRCSRKGCDRDASKLPCVYVFAKIGTTPAQMVLDLPTCVKCAKNITARDLLTDDGWEAICRTFMKLGKNIPQRNLSKLTWIDLPAQYKTEPKILNG